MEITSFRGLYRFLSNFFEVSIFLDGIAYPSVEHAYQAAKTTDMKIRRIIQKLSTPGKAKRYGAKIELREDWNLVKVNIMRSLLESKFRHSGLKEMLLATMDKEIIEGNFWHDNFWGDCFCSKCKYLSGMNMMGRLLMGIRDK